MPYVMLVRGAWPICVNLNYSPRVHHPTIASSLNSLSDYTYYLLRRKWKTGNEKILDFIFLVSVNCFCRNKSPQNLVLKATVIYNFQRFWGLQYSLFPGLIHVILVYLSWVWRVQEGLCYMSGKSLSVKASILITKYLFTDYIGLLSLVFHISAEVKQNVKSLLRPTLNSYSVISTAVSYLSEPFPGQVGESSFLWNNDD